MYTDEHKAMIRAMGRKAISDDSFNEQLQGNIDFVKGYFSDQPNKGFFPQLVAVSMKKEAAIMMLADMPNDADERHQFFFRVGEMFATKQSGFFPVCVFMMTEAWMRGQAFKGEKIHLPIKDNPAKTEAMIISGMTVDGRMNMATIPMHRGATGIVMLGEPNVVKTKEGDNGLVTYILAEFYKGYFTVKKPDKKGEN